MAKDYYGILGVSKDATQDQIKRAYRKLARELHPDVNQEDGAQERFREVSTAYEVLSDPQKRQMVDLGGDPMDSGGGAAGGRAGGDPFAGFGGLGDIMDAFFGGGSGGSAGRGPRSRVQQGSDALLRLELTLEECAQGVNRDVTVDTAVVCDTCEGGGSSAGSAPSTCDTCEGRGEIQSVQRSFLGQVMTSRPCPVCRGFGEVITDPCQQCGGDGRVRSRRTITVKIPAGVGDGMRVRLAGEGEVGPGGGPAGDLFVEVEELQHERFVRDGADLHCHVQVPMTAAALGTVVNIRTLEDEEELTVEPGTQPGTEYVLDGRGLPKLRSNGRVSGHGDLHVHLDVRVPTKLDEDQADLLRQLATAREEEQPEPTVSAGGNGHRNGIFSRFRGFGHR
ncbi:molecular chaperone DnaJ [Actinopolyspora mzabensis]|uniref:Chaperone protein DnaJ n=1 Tax=Actinopolyspora mzabensis TaxID=995066 RepID=A0A1G9E347_ACTMZ|nr:molecular chaperone DnaJ [Actinopolyspora mzabensis]SDK70541.1 molecular chaperone DnaJ [Actinopolyspora mzabensis]